MLEPAEIYYEDFSVHYFPPDCIERDLVARYGIVSLFYFRPNESTHSVSLCLPLFFFPFPPLCYALSAVLSLLGIRQALNYFPYDEPANTPKQY